MFEKIAFYPASLYCDECFLSNTVVLNDLPQNFLSRCYELTEVLLQNATFEILQFTVL